MGINRDIDVEQIKTYETETEEEQRRRRRRARIEQMRREKERVLMMRRIFLLAAPVAVALAVVCTALAVGISKASGKTPGEKRTDAGYEIVKDESTERNTEECEAVAGVTVGARNVESIVAEVRAEAERNQTAEDGGGDGGSENRPADTAGGKGTESGQAVYTAQTTAQTDAPPAEVNSTNVVFIDLDSGEILAQRDYLALINPASMTKVLTVLVAAEHVTDLDDTFTMTIDITDYSYSHGCSSVGFAVGEKVTVRDLFYGTVLPSGGDAAVALATYVAGSHEEFVELMNEKAEALGLSDTAHFTNCVGIYDEDHHCTVYDMAMIMEAALDNELCREILNKHIYTTSVTAEHPEGIQVSNWFLRRIEDKDTGGEVVCAKTGYVQQSGNCAVSYGVDRSGRGYVCATTGAHSPWRCIYDHVALYKRYASE